MREALPARAFEPDALVTMVTVRSRHGTNQLDASRVPGSELSMWAMACDVEGVLASLPCSGVVPCGADSFQVLPLVVFFGLFGVVECQ